MKKFNLGRKLLKLGYLLKSLVTAKSVATCVPEKLKIGFAVLAHERPQYLHPSLVSLFESDLSRYEIDIFVLDDGSSSPEVKEIIEKLTPKKANFHKVYFPKGPSNAGAAINRALKYMLSQKNYDIVGWADPDCLFHPEWLNKTLEIALWAKAYHKDHLLGPFTSFNSSDFEFHKILGVYSSPYGDYVVKRQAGMLNYFFFTEDLKKIGFFDENKDDEDLMTWRMELLKIRNFCTEISWVEHLGENSSLKDFRPATLPLSTAPFAINIAKTGWIKEPSEYRAKESQLVLEKQRKYDHFVRQADSRKTK